MRVEQLEQELVPLVPYFAPVIAVSVGLEWYLIRHDPDAVQAERVSALASSCRAT